MTTKNIDELIDQYIQCHSLIHKTCFGKSGTAAGTWDDFNDITIIYAYLFRVAVLRPLGIDISYDKIFRVPITQILVEPKHGLKVKLNVRRPSEPQTNYWDAFNGTVERGDVRLNFIEFFEGGDNEPPKYEYCRVLISSFSQHKEFEGREGLIQRSDVEIYCEEGLGGMGEK